MAQAKWVRISYLLPSLISVSLYFFFSTSSSSTSAWTSFTLVKFLPLSLSLCLARHLRNNSSRRCASLIHMDGNVTVSHCSAFPPWNFVFFFLLFAERRGEYTPCFFWASGAATDFTAARTETELRSKCHVSTDGGSELHVRRKSLRCDPAEDGRTAWVQSSDMLFCGN